MTWEIHKFEQQVLQINFIIGFIDKHVNSLLFNGIRKNKENNE